MSDAVEFLWTPKELAGFLGYSESTVTRMASQEPHRLPPRVAGMRRFRWVPQVCRDWAITETLRFQAQTPPGKTTGRRRNVTA